MRHELAEREDLVGGLYPPHHVKSRTDSSHGKAGPAQLQAHAGTELAFLDRYDQDSMVLQIRANVSKEKLELYHFLFSNDTSF
jgi:hypothetical protein